MKKKVLICSILGAIVLCIVGIVLVVHYTGVHKINSGKVDAIVVWAHGLKDQGLNAADAKTFIKLFNKSTYRGEGTGEGGTPEYGVEVRFVDGSYLLVNQFAKSRHMFEVSLRDKNDAYKDWYYIESQELYEFLSNILTDADE